MHIPNKSIYLPRRTFLRGLGVTVAFEVIEGGDMEGVEAVGNLRNASAVFFYQDGKWQTGGRVLFNLNPDEVVERFSMGYERIDKMTNNN